MRAAPPLSALLFNTKYVHSTSRMGHPRVLGFAEEKPAVISVDPSSPHSSIAEGFLFRNNINPIFDPSGRRKYKATLSIPSLGGFYTSRCFPMLCSVLCDTDVVIGRDWLSECRAVFRGNTFGHPAPATVSGLPDGHKWTANGTYPWIP